MIPPSQGANGNNNNVGDSPIPECPGAPRRPPRPAQQQGPRHPRSMSRRRLQFNFQAPIINEPIPEIPQAPRRPRLVRPDPYDPTRPRPASRRQIVFRHPIPPTPSAPRANRTRSRLSGEICAPCNPGLVRRLFAANDGAQQQAVCICGGQDANQPDQQDVPAKKATKRPAGACAIEYLDLFVDEESDDDTEDESDDDTEDDSDYDTENDSDDDTEDENDDDDDDEAEMDDYIKRRRTI